MTVAFNFSGSPLPSLFAPAAVLAGVNLLAQRDDGIASLAPAEALARLAGFPHLLCHAVFIADRLAFAGDAPRALARAVQEQRHFEVAELFAFVCPARFAIPTPQGLARALGVEVTDDDIATLK